MPTTPESAEKIRSQVDQAVQQTAVWDLHTHLYPPSFGTPLAPAGADPQGLMLWGVDELLTYHYLVAELFRETTRDELPHERFWSLTKSEQADLIWDRLFRRTAPLSEARRGVLTTLKLLGLDPNANDLGGYRQWFAEQDPGQHIDRVMEISRVERITMTNDVFDDNERERWLADPSIGDDDRFRAVLRFDPLVVDWPSAAAKLRAWGYEVADEFTPETIEEGRRFLREWIARTKAIYCAVSLPPGFRYPATGDDPAAAANSAALAKIVLPECEAAGLPFAMMIGVTRQVNPAIRLAGDTVGPADVESVATLCREFPGVQFLCTMLARENQHELAVTGRKFANLLPFGCWWFLNNPSLIEEITRMRMELLGASFVPQHSDCRVLEQLIYKWDHSREILSRVLADKFTDLAATGYEVTDAAIAKTAEDLLWGVTEAWLGPPKA